VAFEQQINNQRGGKFCGHIDAKQHAGKNMSHIQKNR
jgi:hypothetical protein